jgi:hypothetical protein
MGRARRGTQESSATHPDGFHRAANEIPASDYSRRRDPAGPDGAVNSNWTCAADFSHRNRAALRARHVEVIERLTRGEMPMVCEFIGKPWPDRPVYYWARWDPVLRGYRVGP